MSIFLFTTAHLQVRLLSCLSPLGFPTKNLYAFLRTPTFICPAHLVQADFMWRGMQIVKVFFMHFSSASCCYLSMKFDQVLQNFNPVGKIFPLKSDHVSLFQHHCDCSCGIL